PQYRRGVQQDDTLDRRLQASVEERLAAYREPLPGAELGRADGGAHALDQLPFRGGKHRLKQLRFVAEMVVEGAAGDAGALHDVFSGRAGVALLGEERAGRG